MGLLNIYLRDEIIVFWGGVESYFFFRVFFDVFFNFLDYFRMEVVLIVSKFFIFVIYFW